MDNTILIPARYNSTRFPGKPLASIYGEPMIMRALRIAQASALADSIRVLSADFLVLQAVPAEFRADSPELCRNGTERAAGYVIENKLSRGTMVCILQADEITITGRDLDLAMSVARPNEVTTLASLVPSRRATKNDVFLRPTDTGLVAEFARGDKRLGWHHVGVYITSVEMLRQYQKFGPSGAEVVESLEQLRWGTNGVTIRAVCLPINTESTNHPADIPRVEKQLCKNASFWVKAAAAG